MSATAGLIGLLALAFSPLGTTPSAAASAVNPFTGMGFTIYADGNATLDNAELEGSVAATGTLTTSRGNFNVAHKIAGEGNYTIPLVDGVPTRLLANNFVSSTSSASMFNITNAGATSGTNEADGSIKSVSTAGWTAAQRSNYVRVQPDSSNTDFVIDLQTRLWADAGINGADELARIKTVESSVGAYVNPSLTSANTCLATLPGNAVTVGGSPLTLSGLSTTEANIVDYAQIAGNENLKLAESSYHPTATAPLVIQVPNGTTNIGAINIEGWDASAGAQQSYASYILLDLSKVTNDVTITGLKMGAIYAPNSDVTMNLTQTWNGQVIAKNFVANGSGELHDHVFGASLTCAAATATNGKFAIAKTVTGLGTGVDPGSFTFHYTVNGGTEQTATVNAGETWTSEAIETGATIVVSEVTPTAPTGHTYQGLTLTGTGITVNNGTATLTIGDATTTTVNATNAYAVVSGGGDSNDDTDNSDGGDSDGGDDLAYTGTELVGPALAFGLLAVGVGALLVGARRRRS